MSGQKSNIGRFWPVHNQSQSIKIWTSAAFDLQLWVIAYDSSFTSRKSCLIQIHYIGRFKTTSATLGKKAADETSAASDQTLATLVPTSTAFDCTRKKSGSKKKGLLLFATHWNRDFYFWPLDDAKEQKFVYDVFVRNKNFQWSVWEPKISSIICVHRTLAYVRVEGSEVGSK